MIKMTWFNKLIKNNNGYSSKSWFLVVVTLVGILLLLAPVPLLMVEVYYNHTIATDLNGLAAYIASVSTMFVTVGIVKVWGEKNESNKRTETDTSVEDEDVEITESQSTRFNGRSFS